MSAREDIRVPFGLAVAMAGQPVTLVDECLDEYETAHSAEVLIAAARTLRDRDVPYLGHYAAGWLAAADALDEIVESLTTATTKEQSDA